MKEVRITNETGLVQDTKIEGANGENFLEKYPVDLIQINLVPNDIVHVRIGLSMQPFDLNGVPAYGLIDPRTGQRRLIKSLTFADGEVVEFDGAREEPQAEGPLAASDKG